SGKKKSNCPQTTTLTKVLWCASRQGPYSGRAHTRCSLFDSACETPPVPCRSAQGAPAGRHSGVAGVGRSQGLSVLQRPLGARSPQCGQNRQLVTRSDTATV